ncbi:GmrSD restriction endonuclease domain-containing protein [Streptomyces microflavus]|uniref:GmrSD restriction endonuclease domain-containing protein n=1 Tax=Streptomyces microflavus TaxID=1919 RepID=UPI0033AB86C5
MSEPLPLRKAIERIHNGTMRVPGFQRGFIWEPTSAALLMDSIYKGFPFGSVLLWRTRTALKTEKELGGFELRPPEKDYPVDYVLDGQQRLTSIFSTFQTELTPKEENPEVWLPVYYDFEAEGDAQGTRFVALQESETANAPGRYFPLNCFFDPVAFSSATKPLNVDRNIEIVKVQERFKEALIPVETFESEDRTSVAIVFERVNRMGVELTMFELLTAWTWSEDFDLQEKFLGLAETFENFGFGSIGADNDLMLRCCSAILQGDPAPESLVNINGTNVRASFEVVEKALGLAIDFVRTNLGVRHLKFMPYSAQLIPLATFFSVRQSQPITNDERAVLLRWFWRSSFGHRYSGNPGRNIKRDVEAALELRNGAGTTLEDIAVDVNERFFTENQFNSRTVATKTMILLLASLKPKSFLSGQGVELDKVLAEPNRHEYHHCFPRSHLRKLPNSPTDKVTNCLANFAIISRAENRKISDRAPSVYRVDMPANIEEIKSGALLPDSLFRDDFPTFLEERTGLLVQAAKNLCGS